jgi:hypothetical protein
MGWFILKHIFSTLLAIVNIRRLSDQEKDLDPGVASTTIHPATQTKASHQTQ